MSNWKTNTIKELATQIGSGFACNKSFEVPNGHVHLRTHNIDTSGNLNTDLFIKIDHSKIDSKKSFVSEGDILFNNTNSTELVGKTALIKEDKQYAFSNHLTKIQVKENEILPSFVVYYFNKLWLEGYFERICKKWIGQSGVNSTVLKDITITYPDLLEQKRITKRLSTVFERVDKSAALLKENVKHSELLMSSVLDGFFDKIATNYPSVSLAKHIEFIGGSQPTKSLFSYKKQKDYVRLIQIRDYKSDKYLVYIDENSTKKFCTKDDVMIGRYGPPVFQILRGLEGAYNVALMKAIPDEKVIMKDYLYYFLMNGRIQNYIISISQRAAGQSGVNKKALEAYKIAIPPLPEQQRIVDNIKAAIPKIKETQKLVNQNLDHLKALKGSLLDQAFKGEL
jgi:restriction endonuclease S subunit